MGRKASSEDKQQLINSPELQSVLNMMEGPPSPEDIQAAFASLLDGTDIPVSLVVPLEILKFRRAISGETDRGAALYAAAYIDNQLRLLVQLYLVQDESRLPRIKW